jgi:hypothetical protein
MYYRYPDAARGPSLPTTKHFLSKNKESICTSRREVSTGFRYSWRFASFSIGGRTIAITKGREHTQRQVRYTLFKPKCNDILWRSFVQIQENRLLRRTLANGRNLFKLFTLQDFKEGRRIDNNADQSQDTRHFERTCVDLCSYRTLLHDLQSDNI